MPSFSFTALDADGREIRGDLDAPDMPDARRQLRARSLMPVEMALGSAAKDSFGLGGISSPARMLWTRERDKQFFFRQMALMIQSGHRVRQALDTCSELVERNGLSRSIRTMVDNIDRGHSFADALRAEGRRFPAFVSALVEAGEQSGTLDQILGEIAGSLERAAELRNALVRALVFPIITLLVAFAVLSGIVFWLVPILSDFITRQGSDIHWTMQMLVDFTEFMFDWGAWIAGGVAMASLILALAYSTERGRLAIDRVLLWMPIFGKTMRYFEMSRMGGVGTLLLESGLRQVEALKVLSNVTQNRAYRHRYLTAADDVLTGQKVSTALGGGIVPKLVTHMISVGEASGGLDAVLDRIGVFYRDEVATRVSVILSTLVPAVTILVGLVVAIIYISVILTILGAYNSIR
ncbi:MAG: type II secretion system F family protein [Pseudomonadota bacterium]